MTERQEQGLGQGFQQDYERLRRDFDELERTDSYRGPQMEALVGEFLERWDGCMQEAVLPPAEVRRAVKHSKLNKCTYYESLDDDLCLMQTECKYRRTPGAAKGSSYLDNYGQPELSAATSEPHRLVGDVYRRACEATYLRVTYNKARLGQEDDRREPVRWGQRAIRYDPHAPKGCLWYSVALGWCLDVVSNPREQALAGETFKRATQRCLAMEPDEALAHHLLGIYYYHVSGLNWFQRSVARSFLGCKIHASYADSEREFRRELECRADWLPTSLWMAKVLLAQSRPLDEVRRWIRFGLRLEANEPTTELDRDELRELARKFQVSLADAKEEEQQQQQQQQKET